MIRTFQKQHSNKQWYEVCVTDTVTNDFCQFFYEIINGKLLKFSEHTSKNDCVRWINEQRKWYKYEEVSNDFLDSYPIWNPATDLTDEIRKQYRVNETFRAHNRAQNKTYTYKYLGTDEACQDPCYNIALQNIDTSEIMHVENEWFNQRKITREC